MGRSRSHPSYQKWLAQVKTRRRSARVLFPPLVYNTSTSTPATRRPLFVELGPPRTSFWGACTCLSLHCLVHLKSRRIWLTSKQVFCFCLQAPASVEGASKLHSHQHWAQLAKSAAPFLSKVQQVARRVLLASQVLPYLLGLYSEATGSCVTLPRRGRV